MKSKFITKILACFCIGAIGTGVLAGCSSNANSESSGAASQTSAPSETTSAESGSKEGTKIVSTIMGDVEVPVDPQRVVANWYVGDVIALDLNLVGFNAWAQESMPFYDELMATTKIENWEPEDVMSLEPDLIITYSEEDFAKFSKVAPVLVIAESIPSPERVKILGEATGRTSEAETAVKAFETKLAAAKDKFEGDTFKGKTFSIMEDWGSTGEWAGIYYETGSRGGTLVYNYLELQKSSKLEELIAETGKGRGSISYEVAHEYFGDYILWFRQEGKESEYAQTEIWKSIPAVAEGRVVEIPGVYQGLFYYSDVLSLTAQLDYMVDAINTLA